MNGLIFIVFTLPISELNELLVAYPAVKRIVYNTEWLSGLCQMFTVVMHVKSVFMGRDLLQRGQRHGGDMTVMYGADQ